MGLKGLIAVAALSVSCAVSPSPPSLPPSSMGFASYARDTTQLELLCDSTFVRPALAASPLLQGAYIQLQEAEKRPIELPVIFLMGHAYDSSLVAEVLKKRVSREDSIRIHTAYTWDSTSALDDLRDSLNLPVPSYVVFTSGARLFDILLSEKLPPHSFDDSLRVAEMVGGGTPLALARTWYAKPDLLLHQIFINPFFVESAIAVPYHEIFHFWQHMSGSPVAIDDPAHGQFKEAVASYVQARLNFGTSPDSSIDASIRDRFAQQASTALALRVDKSIVVPYYFLPAAIANTAIRTGPVQAILLASKPLVCPAPLVPVDTFTGPVPTGQPRQTYK